MTVRSVSVADLEFDGHGEPTNIGWKLGCICGCETFKFRAYRWTPDQGVDVYWLTPSELVCASGCGLTFQFLDTEMHGYNGVLGGSSTRRAVGERSFVPCKSCNSDEFSMTLRLEYPFDLLERGLPRGMPVDRVPDLFSWITLFGACAACDNWQILLDLECA